MHVLFKMHVLFNIHVLFKVHVMFKMHVLFKMHVMFSFPQLTHGRAVLEWLCANIFLNKSTSANGLIPFRWKKKEKGKEMSGGN